MSGKGKGREECAGQEPSLAELDSGWAEALLEWYRRNRRKLPWRDTGDPYHVLVSEVMLQQTRVDTVIPYFQRFVATFPTVTALAAASEAEVLRLWTGLGYYARARRLREAARKIAEEHRGVIPSNLDELRRLPGVGAYTAGAVASIAFGRPTPVVDGNVKRVYSRLLALERLLTPGAWNRLAAAALTAAPGADPGDFNQALMELGAVVCRPERPACGECPLSRYCRAFQRGIEAELPFQEGSPQSQRVEWRVFVVVRDSRFLMRERPGSQVLTGLWEFPAVEQAGGASPPRAPVHPPQLPFPLEIEVPLGEFRHAITTRRIHAQVFRARLVGRLPDGWSWVDPWEADLPRPSWVDKVRVLLPADR
ncbi:MAG: A/G-specific adenine glycosylase [Acidobacteriota bacterium]